MGFIPLPNPEADLYEVLDYLLQSSSVQAGLHMGGKWSRLLEVKILVPSNLDLIEMVSWVLGWVSWVGPDVW